MHYGPLDRPYVALSFDDVANGRRAGALLARFGVSACFFVCPPVLDASAAERARFCRERLHMPLLDLLTWRDVDELLYAGHDVGAHSNSHRSLSSIPVEELDSEISGCRERLMARIGTAAHFAWPYGRFNCMTREAAKRVFAAGYVSCASTERGSHVAPVGASVEKLCIRRDQWIAGWPTSHMLYFLARSSARADPTSSLWPADLEPHSS